MTAKIYNVLILCTGNAAADDGEGTETDKANAFRDTFRALECRVALFLSLPIASLDRLSLLNKIREIGKS